MDIRVLTNGRNRLSIVPMEYSMGKKTQSFAREQNFKFSQSKGQSNS